jgi:hypothetical protein
MRAGTGMQHVDSAPAWAGSGGGFVGAPVRGGMQAMSMQHSQVQMHAGQPANGHQQIMQDLSYQIERIQHIMNELNQLRLPNEIMLQLSDYITHLRKQLHQHTLSMHQLAVAVVPPMGALPMEQHSAGREPIAREVSRGEPNQFSPRAEGRRDRNRSGGRPSKRHWGPTEAGATYIEREEYVGDVRGDGEQQHDGHGFGGTDDNGKRTR